MEESISNGTHSNTKSSDVASKSREAMTESDLVATAKKGEVGAENNGHNTAVITKAAANYESDDEHQVEEILSRTSTLLSCLDSNKYQEALLQDSYVVLSLALLPLSLPWNHPESTSNPNIRDIDEMPNIRIPNMESLLYGPYGEELKSNTFHYKTYRTKDPGIIHLESFHVNPLLAKQASQVLKRTFDDQQRSLDGEEVMLNQYQTHQQYKRRRIDCESMSIRRRCFSISFGSVSSRQTIRKPASRMQPFVLPVKLYTQSLNGINMTSPSLSSFLGSYNGNQKMSSSKVSKVGQCIRRIWTSAIGPPQRQSYKSLLDGEKIEPPTHLKPSKATVAIRVGGRIICASSLELKSYNLALERWRAQSESELELTEDDVEVPIHLLKSDTVEFKETNTLQCSFSADAGYFEALHSSRCLSHEQRCIKTLRKPAIINQPDSAKFSVQINPPIIDCLPIEDGSLRIVCRQPGKLSGFLNNTISSDAAVSIVTTDNARRQNCCAICWGPKGILLTCSNCYLTVHAKCFTSRKLGDEAYTAWLCDACTKFQKTPNLLHGRDMLVCELCPHKGGAIFQDNGRWVHKICKVWTGATRNPISTPQRDILTCAICSDKEKSLVKCAASGCCIYFHPMCASLSSVLYQMLWDNQGEKITMFNVSESTQTDTFLCTQYTLSMLSVKSTEHDKNNNIPQQRLLPIAYCGYHNPERAHDLQGVPPIGAFFSDNLRVPPQLNKASVTIADV